MSGFEWNEKRSAAAVALATGHTIAEVAQQSGITERTLYRWKNDTEFAAEVDRLSLMVDIAGRAERLRIAMRMVRAKGDKSDRDLLDWLKFAQSETDGVKLDLAKLAAAFGEDETPVAGGGPGSGGAEPPDAGGSEAAETPAA